MKKCIISQLTFAFTHQDQRFFDNVHVSFESGNVYFIQGKNGVGKSTFFSIVQGTTPTNALLTGSITYDDKTYVIKNNQIPSQITSFVKTVVQDSTSMLAPTMSVEENIQLAQLARYPLPVPLTTQTTMPPLLDTFNLKRTSNVRHLSGGQKQILAIIMALQKPTHILLLDEPTAALDEKNSILVMNFLTTLAQEKQLIIIVITHDNDLIKDYNIEKRRIIIQDNAGTRIIKQT